MLHRGVPEPHAENRPASRRRRRRRQAGRLGLFLVAVGASLALLAIAGAVNVAGFEIDAGNTTATDALYSGNEGGDDWTLGSSEHGVFVESTEAPHTAAEGCYDSNIDLGTAAGKATLICDGNSDPKFRTLEPEQNIVSPSGKTPDASWPIKAGNVRPKNDFSHSYIHAVLIDSPCDDDALENNIALDLAGHVGDNEGDHFWGWEFDQTVPTNFNQLKNNSGDSFDLGFNRTEGDFLISATVPGNTSNPVLLEVFTVTGFEPNGDAIFSLAEPACSDDLTTLATNNFNEITAPKWNVPVCDPTADNSHNTCRLANGNTTAEDLLAERDFAETRVDLTAFGILPCVSTVIFSSRSAHVLGGADVQDVGGGEFNLCGAKSGVKFHDHNANGVKNTGDEGLNDWTIKLYGDTDGDRILDAGEATALQTTTTATVDGVDGFYRFESLANGDYIVCEVKQATWNESLPNSGTGEDADCTTESGDSTLARHGYGFTMAGIDQTGNDFGNFHNGTKSGTKFVDTNGDGDRDTGEPGLAGVQIHLFGTDGGGNAVDEHTTTDVDGAYSFSVPPGSYTACETIPTGYTQSYPSSGPSCSGHTGAGGIGWSVTLTSGDTDSGNDFGNFQNGTKSGTKFVDTNGDGDRDTGEPGLDGVQIHLAGTDGRGNAVHLHTTTAGGGLYSFSAPPGSYTACETVPTGYTQSYPTATTPDSVACTSPHSGRGWTVTLTSGSTDSGNDFGNFQNGTISGMKFKDANANGVKDDGEIGLGTWIIHLFGTDGQGNAVHTQTTTAADGTYSFGGLAPGTYTVCEQTAPGKPGWVQSFPTSGADCTGHTHSETITPGPNGYFVTLTSGGTPGGKDFGNTPLSRAVVTFEPLADLPGGADATHATSISCVDTNGASIGSVLNLNTLTTNNVKTNQSSLTCTITFIDP